MRLRLLVVILPRTGVPGGGFSPRARQREDLLLSLSLRAWGLDATVIVSRGKTKSKSLHPATSQINHLDRRLCRKIFLKPITCASSPER